MDGRWPRAHWGLLRCFAESVIDGADALRKVSINGSFKLRARGEGDDSFEQMVERSR